jgi:serine/threonine protein kinase/Tfp pilus assembly protein PilF
MSESLRAGAVSGSVSQQVAEVVAEITDRLHAGEPVDVEQYLARHPELADRLRPLVAALDLLARFRSSAGADGPPTRTGAGDELTGTLGDFRIIREVGHGGMGVVYEAEQISLARRVALKVLPFAATIDPRHLQRFHNEARAAASLEHPHIVPVYGVGCERGVHYYAMKFIDGQSLASLLQQHRADPASPGRQPPEGPGSPEAATAPAAAARTQRDPQGAAAFRQVAGWGIQAAEALEHAHSLGVVHRDIKPANLMIDGRGALWVTDYGLARTALDAGLTMTGDILGTLRYMSPEQALAKRVVIDHRTDVYSLGATLYELLTLRPVFPGTDRQDLLRQIAFEEPAPLRRLNRAIAAELETIVLKAVEKNPADRYATAQELADDLEHFLKDEPIRARRPGLLARGRKWARRHRAATAAAVVCLLVTLAAGVGSAAWVLGERANRQHEAEAKVLAALDEAMPRLPEGEPKDPVLMSALERAEAALDTGLVDPELRGRVQQLRRDQQMMVDLEEARLQSAICNSHGSWDWPGAEQRYARAFAGYGLDVPALRAQEAAQRVRASRIGPRLTAALDDWAFARDWMSQGSGAPLRGVADLADDDPWRRRLRQAVGHRDWAVLERLADEGEALRQPPAYSALLAHGLGNARSWASAERLLRRVQPEHPADFWVNLDLAVSLSLKQPPDWVEATRFYQAALALRPRSSGILNNFGLALYMQGKTMEAEAAFRKAIKLRPDSPEAHNNLGVALQAQGKLAEAEAACREAIKLKPDFHEAHNTLANTLQAQRKLPEAIMAFRTAIGLKPDYATPHFNLGLALEAQGKFAAAEAAYRKAIEIKSDYAKALYKLATALTLQRKRPEAITAYRKIIGLRPDHAEAHCNLGILLVCNGEFAEALTFLRRGHELGSRDPKWAYNSADWVQHCERLLRLESKLPALLSGADQPADTADRIALAVFCGQNHWSAVAARFYAEAFAEQPPLATSLQAQHRYNAACAAALASCGQGQDAGSLDATERAGLRRQALDWLRADLEAYRLQLNRMPGNTNPAVRARMQHWQQETAFDGVRGSPGLAKLPPAERQAWQRLWEEVEALRQLAETATKPGP